MPFISTVRSMRMMILRKEGEEERREGGVRERRGRKGGGRKWKKLDRPVKVSY